jgi:transcription termination/antitermination protein NusA
MPTGSDTASMTDTPLDLLARPVFSRVVTADVREATPDVAVLAFGEEAAHLPVTEFYPNRTWSLGGVYHLAATEAGVSPVQVSANVDEIVEMLLEGVSPEVRDGRVRVMAVSRQVGIRSKVAVAATQDGVDPVGACLGRGANRVKAVSAMLLGERLDVVAYHSDPDRFLQNALAVAADRIEHQEDGTVNVFVPRHQLAAARGGGNLNVVLASRLVGKRIQVVAS